jgi:hypothetical protein
MKSLKSFFIKRDIFEAFSFLFKILKLFGMAAFNLKSESFQSSFLDFFWFVAVLSYPLSNFEVYTAEPISYSKVLSIGLNMAYKLPPIFNVCFLVRNFMTRKTFHQIFKRLSKFDKQVKIGIKKIMFVAQSVSTTQKSSL